MTLLADPAFPRVARHLERMGVGALALFREPCIERRLTARLRARGKADLAQYATLLDADEQERLRLVSSLAIGVTSFYRNPTTWRRLGEELDRAGPLRGFRAWSAGCATGEEAYTIAMLLAGTGRARRADPSEWTIEATDLDERSLAIAAQGRYPALVLRDIEPMGLPRGAVRDGGFEIEPALRERIRFVQDDLTASRARGPYDLVVCRNVLIYFGEAGQAKALEALIGAVAPGGLLLLGRTELAAAELPAEIVAVDLRQRLFRRCA
ncbi:MAG: protein-glutamate O-methyltransferase CheR [Gemmatimonadales bacterium]